MQFEATQHKNLYGLLGRCLISELDLQTVQSLQSPAIAEVLTTLDAELGPYLSKAWNQAEFDNAAAEYCALFVLPGGVTQVASHWVPGPTEQNGHKIVAGVEQILENFGLQVEQQRMGNVPKDNVGLLLLLAAELFALDASEASTHGQQFVANYVTPWALDFGAALRDRNSTPLYRAIGELLVLLHAGHEFESFDTQL